MDAKIEKSYVLHLVLTEAEARLLAALVQNAFSADEDAETAALRSAIFMAVKNGMPAK